MPEPPGERPAGQPWPTYPMTFRVSSAHEEAGERVYAVSTQALLGDDDGTVRALRLVDVVLRGRQDGRGRGHRARDPAQPRAARDGLHRPQTSGLVEQLGVDVDARGNVARDGAYMSSVPGVFVAGDAGRGQSLIVWAIAEGRAAASAVDEYLTGSTALPRPVRPTDRPILV